MKQTLLFCLFAVSVMTSMPGFAQGVTTASIRGQIVDSNGEALPGATIIARHNPTGTEYGTITLGNGGFNLPNLRIGGPYTVTVAFVGFETQEITDLNLLLGQVLDIDFQLLEDITTLGEVVVTANETFNSDRTGSSQAFDNREIRKLPTITRSAADIYRLSPSSDGNSFAGRNDQFNNFSLDGSIFNNPFGLDAATPGGQTDAQPISLDAIEQIQVAVAPYDITQSGFTGASVNAVTKSGTNKFTGTVFGFYRTDELTGSKVNGEDVFVPDLTQLQTGFSIGGPIIKDKLFFFANMEVERRENLGSSFLAARPGLTGSNVSRVEAADLDRVAAILDGFDYDPGVYEGYIHDTENEKGIIKLDWNINQNHTLVATYNFLYASRDLPANPTAIGRRGPDATTLQFRNSGYQINNDINSGLLELRSRFGNNISNKFQIGYSAFNDSRDPFSTPFPVININRDGVRYIVAGHEPFSINNRLDQYVLQLTNNFEIYSGKHTYTFGVNFERFDFDNSFNLDAYGGTFGPGFASIDDFEAYANDPNGLLLDVQNAQELFDTNNANDSWALAESTVGQFAVYAQDRYQISDRFTLTYGVRMDFPLYFDTQDKIEENIERKGGLLSDGGTYDPDIIYYDENGNAFTSDQTELPEQTPLISPRAGFNWDVNGNQYLQVRGGSGLFTGRLPFVWIGNQVANPDFFFRTTTDPDFKFPRVWRTSLGVDKAFDGGLVLTLDLAYTKDINAQFVQNNGLRQPSATLQGVDNRMIYDPATDRSLDAFGGINNIYTFTNTDEGRSFNVTVEAKKSWNNGYYATLAYNYLDAQDASSLRAEITSDIYDLNPALGNVNQPVLSNSIYGNQHRFVGTANKEFTYGNGRWGTTVSMFYEYAKGGRFSYTYSGDINNDGSFNNDLIYIPTAADINNMDFFEADNDGDGQIDNLAQEQAEALEAYIQQDDYLSENRGSFAERNAELNPWFSRWDLRILQDYNFDNGNAIQFSLDILNVGNLISSDWGVREFPTSTQLIGVTTNEIEDGVFVPTYSFDPNITETFTPDTGLLSRWQLQFGLRYSF